MNKDPHQLATIMLVKHLISINKDLIEKTAIRNCHCIGLNSFIINEKPRIRLFIADNYCELYKPFDFRNPTIPIHRHKYDDIFYTISGKLIQHFYIEKEENSDVTLNKYNYKRIKDSEHINHTRIGEQNLAYLNTSNKNVLESNELHTISIKKKKLKNASWIIIETKEDQEFTQEAYHAKLEHKPDLYKKFDYPPMDYLYNRFISNI